jgi:hypothetical protein
MTPAIWPQTTDDDPLLTETSGADSLLDKAAVAAMLQVSTSTLARFIRTG